jgi:antirestriction protein ArdC
MLLGEAGEYLTFKQIKERGGSVKKGAKSRIVVFYTQISSWKRTQTNEEGEEETITITCEHAIPVLKYYRVFHIKDTTGIKSKIEVPQDNTLQPIEAAENIINGYLSRESSLQFHNDKPSGQAYYSPSQDCVVVPMMSQYKIIEEYYSTVFHELTHSTMKETRCNRKQDMKNAAFGSKDYSREELVAEIGSAMLCHLAGLESDKAFTNSVAYIQGWLKALKNDNKAIVWAASRAEKAAAYIKG